MNLKAVIGDNIRGFRHKLNLTQEELAEIAGLHINYISSVERGERNIGIVNVGKIAHALKVKPHVLLMVDAYREGITNRRNP